MKARNAPGRSPSSGCEGGKFVWRHPLYFGNYLATCVSELTRLLRNFKTGCGCSSGAIPHYLSFLDEVGRMNGSLGRYYSHGSIIPKRSERVTLSLLYGTTANWKKYHRQVREMIAVGPCLCLSIWDDLWASEVNCMKIRLTSWKVSTKHTPSDTSLLSCCAYPLDISMHIANLFLSAMSWGIFE
jgi:hypothetical protein